MQTIGRHSRGVKSSPHAGQTARPPEPGPRVTRHARNTNDDNITLNTLRHHSKRSPSSLPPAPKSILKKEPNCLSTELFMAVWDESIMTEIVRQTNEYAWQRIAPIFEVEAELPEPLSTWSDVTTDEMYRYFAILICMSMCNRAVMSDYWTTGVMGMPDFRRLMSRNRFFLISRFLHFVDNDTCFDYSLSSYDKKIIKIRPILDHCNERFTALYVPYQHLSLDESLLLWKGRLSWVQCIRTKAARFGIKTYELCEAETGYLLRCLIYAGKDSTMRQEPIHGFENCTAKVVLELLDGFLDAGHCLVMDNWYNQLSLTRYLKSRKTDVIGTMNPRRVHVPDDIKQANPRMQRGGQIARHCGDICLIAWKDVKLVTAVSTFHNDSRVPSRRAGAQIIKPRMIADYNRYMGGVDSKDQQLSMYLMERKRGMKWYIKVFKRLLNTSLLNTYIIHKKTPVAAKPLTHRQFRMEVALGLLEKFPRAETGRNIRSNDAETPRRLMKGVDHFVLNTPTIGTGNRKTQKRCVRCLAANRRTMVTLICSFCNVALCAGTCWVEYHTLRTL
ncbi:hypothetical protein evm_005494 [Chilo suppressalis]|nr:hypothetical protein evm_005494 [Chilo suppressalis]